MSHEVKGVFAWTAIATMHRSVAKCIAVVTGEYLKASGQMKGSKPK